MFSQMFLAPIEQSPRYWESIDSWLVEYKQYRHRGQSFGKWHCFLDDGSEMNRSALILTTNSNPVTCQVSEKMRKILNYNYNQDFKKATKKEVPVKDKISKYIKSIIKKIQYNSNI